MAASCRTRPPTARSTATSSFLSASPSIIAANKILDANLTSESMTYVWLANFCGLPSVSVPAGFIVHEGQERASQEADEPCGGKSLLAFAAEAEAVGRVGQLLN
ncbi:hypothetical protein EDB80DRAFT_239530 [Ilyonectria destructans]|nr:hypothetical protein EDB80DRAFT_239530 [Ilyonectria destructans]